MVRLGLRAEAAGWTEAEDRTAGEAALQECKDACMDMG